MDENSTRRAFEALRAMRAGSRKSKVNYQRPLPTIRDENGIPVQNSEEATRRWLRFWAKAEAGCVETITHLIQMTLKTQNAAAARRTAT